MVYFVGVLTKVSRTGVVINAGEAQKCNIWVGVDDQTRLPDRLEAGRPAKIMAVPRWRKRTDGDDESFALSFTAISIETR